MDRTVVGLVRFWGTRNETAAGLPGLQILPGLTKEGFFPDDLFARVAYVAKMLSGRALDLSPEMSQTSEPHGHTILMRRVKPTSDIVE